MEVGAGFAAFLLPAQVENVVTRTMTNAINTYDRNMEMGLDGTVAVEAVDFVQQQVKCCGVYGPEDWKDVFETPKDYGFEDNFLNLTVPYSCCIVGELDMGSKTCLSYNNGCLYRMNFIISQSAVIIATCAVTVSFVQVI